MAQIIIFDGVCNFCNGSVNFIIKHDPCQQFVFTPMQSDTAQQLIEKYNVPAEGFDTFLLIKNNRCFLRTDAALEIAQDLTNPWPMLRVLRILPRTFRDYFYKLFARNRYTLFGKREVCMVPTKEVMDRFIE